MLRLTLREPTTSQLATELGVGLASASEHARALRRAGLISTIRTGRSVRHSCTQLGHRPPATPTARSRARCGNADGTSTQPLDLARILRTARTASGGSRSRANRRAEEGRWA
ncbi:helix-turn-helix domain-containing protein [Kitasatospora sp. RB6PN24]|nr:helix-turn-helix domain-containing protein [Kitasatospora humi]